MALLTLGLSHRSAPLAVRERLAFTEADLPDALDRLRGLSGIDESAILSTCNRTELTLVAAPEQQPLIMDWWGRERGVPLGDFEPHVYAHRDRASVLHGLRVASGLDSMVVGEPQILGQVKQAYDVSRRARALGPVLSRLFQHSFAVAKLVRSSTDIGSHPVSVAFAAVRMAQRIFADLRQETAVLVGAGEFMQLLARHLRQHGVGRIIIANRSLDAAQRLAREVSGYAISLNDLPSYLSEADLLISGTGARGLVIDADTMRSAIGHRRRKPVFMIDLAVPRDIDPALDGLEDIYLYTIDDLQQIVTDNLAQRDEAARHAEVIVQEHATEFTRWLDSRDAAVTIRQLREHARGQRDEVLARARRRLAAGESPDAVMEFVANTLSNKLVHLPSQTLRHADAVEQALLVNGVRRLYELPDDDESGH